MASYIFGGDTGETPESVRQKREIANMLLGQTGGAKNWGEGFNSIAKGLVSRWTRDEADGAQKAGQASANDTFSALTAMLTGQGGATPSAGFSGAPAGVPTGADAASIRAGMIARGLPEHIADGFLMNFQDESGLNPGINEQNPTVPGSRGGYGLYQLTGPRRVAYEQYAKQMGVDPSNVDAQLDFMMSELQGSEANAAKSIFGTQDAGSAAAAIATNFLRPAKQHLDARVSRYTAGGGQPAPVQVASLDPSIGMPQAQPAQLPPIGPSGGPQMAAAPQQPGMVPQMPPMQPQAPMAPQQQPMQTAQGPSLQMLMEAAANPWLNEGQRGIVNSMIAQEMQRQDPRYQQELRAGDLGIQRAEFELNALRNKPPPLPGAPKTEKIYDPETGREKMVQWNERTGAWEDLGGVSAPKEPLVQVNTGGQGPKLGSLSPDYGYVLDPATGEAVIDPATGLPTAAAVPGSPAAQAQEQAAAAAAAQSGSQVTTDVEGAATTLATTRSVLDLLDNSDQPTTGTLSRPFAMYSGSPAGKIRSYVNTLQSGVALGAMQRLKEASATGATGFGALSAPELNILISNIGALDPDNTEPEIFRETVLRIEDQSKRVIADIKRNVSPERIQELGLQPLIDAFGDKPKFDYNSETAPEGWGGDASLWKFLSPEDRALW